MQCDAYEQLGVCPSDKFFQTAYKIDLYRAPNGSKNENCFNFHFGLSNPTHKLGGTVHCVFGHNFNMKTPVSEIK